MNSQRYRLAASTEHRMKNLLQAGRVLASDLASTILFLVIYLATDNLYVAVGLGMALGVAQIGWAL
jgi:intracellular septation protein